MTQAALTETNTQANKTTPLPQPRPSLLINAASNWAVLVLNILVGLVLTPVIIAHIGKGGYGIWTLTISFIGYFGLLRLGVGTAIMRFIPYYDGRDDKKALDGTFSTAMAIYIAVGLLILAVSFIGCRSISDFFGQGQQFSLMLRIIGIAAAISCPCAVFDAIIRSRENFVAANLIASIMALAKAAGLTACLYLGYGLITMTLLMVFLSVFCLLVDIIIFTKVCPDIKFSIKLIRLSYLRRLLSLGILVTITSLGFILRFQSERIIIGKFMNMQYLGVFAVAATLMTYFRNTIGATTRVLRPRFGYLDGRRNYERSVSLFLTGTKFAALVACGLALLLMVAGPAFIRLWVGSGFEPVYPVLLVLAAAYMVGQSQTTCVSMLGGFGKQGLLAALALAEGIANVALGIILVRNFGMVGVAVAIAVPMIIFQGIIQPTFACRVLGIRTSQYFKQCLVKPWALVIFLFLAATLADLPRLAVTWPSFILFALAATATFAAISYQLVLGPQERSLIINKITVLRLFPVPSKQHQPNL